MDGSGLRFTVPEGERPGLIASMLEGSYADLVEAEPDLWRPEVAEWRRFDREVFDHPDTVGACVFLTWRGDDVIGFGSYDPRQAPEYGRVGHNCVLPAFRGRGFGKAQIEEIVCRLRARGIRTAKTSTLSGPWHLPARRMYIACGFHEVEREPWQRDPSRAVVEYERRL